MMVEALVRLNPLVPISSYCYVGMGSIFFRDFRLIHRQLGIHDMITVEGTTELENRVRFNLPLASIKLMMGPISAALPRIDLEAKPHIAWLDYETHVGPEELGDIEEFAGRCAPGSVLIVTVDADRFREEEDRERWLSELGSDRPGPADPMERADYALLSYRALRERIDGALDARNAGVLDPARRIQFQQMFHFVYADGAQMLTVGGALVADSDQQRWADCEIGSLEFVRAGEESHKLEVPVLTRREVQHLLGQLPQDHGDLEGAARIAGIPSKDAREFASVYRYAPIFVEAEDW